MTSGQSFMNDCYVLISVSHFLILSRWPHEEVYEEGPQRQQSPLEQKSSPFQLV